MDTFKSLGISAPVVKALNELNINHPTAIQVKSIPFLLKFNSDFVGQAQTGTGKTAAFGLPLLEKIDPESEKIQGLVLAPTRELCRQISKQFFKYTKYTHKVFVESVYGGEKIELQMHRLQKPTQLLVATPGRLLDLLDRSAVDLSEVHTVVLDEADEMLNMGFKKELDAILKMTSEKTFTWLFSATFPEELERIISKYLSKDVKRVQIEKEEVVNKLIEHQYYVCDPKLKMQYIMAFLRTQPKTSGIIFCRTKAAVENLIKQLKKEGFSAGELHGDMSQSDREKSIRMLKTGKIKTLVTTDIAARGIDIDDIAYVVHYQLPDQLENYTHRSGRTARAGKRGISLVFISSEEIRKVRTIEKILNISFIKI